VQPIQLPLIELRLTAPLKLMPTDPPSDIR
jgi:hypothetical protein